MCLQYDPCLSSHAFHRLFLPLFLGQLHLYQDIGTSKIINPDTCKGAPVLFIAFSITKNMSAVFQKHHDTHLYSVFGLQDIHLSL